MRLFLSLLSVLTVAVASSVHAQQACADGGILVDFGDTGYTEHGAWETPPSSYYTTGEGGTDSRRTGQVGAWAQWAIKVPAAGKYRVYFWHVPTNNSTAKIEVTHNGTTDTIERNMQYGHTGWSTLGDFDFAAGSDATVRINQESGMLFVDSVKIINLQDYKPPAPLPPYPKPDGTSAHVDEKGNLILNGQPYPVLYQEVGEGTLSENGDLPYADEIFDIAQAQGVNTLGATLFWNKFETSPGVYDYTIIDAIIDKARARNMHLDLVLFFGFRNLRSYYVPEWIMKDHVKYLNVKLPDGKDDVNYKVSPFADATRAAESAALQALFTRVVQKDPTHQVVIMAQLENEMPSMPDYSAAGLAAWNQQVPKELMDYLVANEGNISRVVWNQWHKNGHKTEGTWAQVFGDDPRGHRFFGVWSMGHNYIEPLTLDIKKILNIPLYGNAWQYESTEAYQFMDIFHASAPDFDGMGPDAYGTADKWENDVSLSWRPWLHMTIAEQHHCTETLWRATANYNTLINGVYFGVEGGDWLMSKETYALYTSMYPLIASKRGTGEMTGFLQGMHGKGEEWSEYFNDLKITYIATVRPHTFAGSGGEIPMPSEKQSSTFLGELDGEGLVVSLGNGEYVLTSTRMDIALSYINGGPISVTDAQQGHFENGNWVSDGPAQAQQEEGRVRFSFPTENRKYGQIRFKLSSTASNPAVSYEAERAKLIGQAETFHNYNCSGGMAVDNVKIPGDGVAFATNAGFDCNAVTIRYATANDVKASISVNGAEPQDVDFPATGTSTNWAEKTVAISVPNGATVTYLPKKGVNSSPSIDTLIISRDAPK